MRSSLGAKAHRKSFAGGRSGEAGVMMSAKKRARQSEYARRKSKIGVRPGAAALDPGNMQVDE